MQPNIYFLVQPLKSFFGQTLETFTIVIYTCYYYTMLLCRVLSFFSQSELGTFSGVLILPNDHLPCQF